MPFERGLMRPLWLLLVLGVAPLIAVVIGHAIWHGQHRADVLSAARQSPAAAAEMIALRFGSQRAVCHPVKPRDDIDNLISALMALERFGASPMESTVETLTVRVTGWLGLKPPDLSYGPGQIRLSRAASLTADMGQEAPQGRSATARALLEPCSARKIARQLIETARLRANVKAVAYGGLGHAEISRLAAIYNAQAGPTNEKAALAHRLFNRIAYHLTLHYRYAVISG